MISTVSIHDDKNMNTCKAISNRRTIRKNKTSNVVVSFEKYSTGTIEQAMIR